jgi:hypothetical protein
MVLPQPAAHDAHGQAVGWADEIGLSLGLSGGGAIVLVDRAHPARLGDLVRTLRHTWPDIDVITDVQSLDQLAPGSVIVLAPRPEDADWLNQRRQLFAERKLKAVLWCDEATTVALARGAPDLYDWIGHRQTCPPGPAPFAVAGIRAAFQMEWPVAWSGTPTREAVEEVVRAALPGEAAIEWVSGKEPYETLLERMAEDAIVGIEVVSERQLRRARWAYAEAKRKGRIILIVRELDCPGFWPVRDSFLDLGEARRAVGNAGFDQGPGRLCALLDLEPELVTFVTSLPTGQIGGAKLEEAAAESMDPADGLWRFLPAAERPWLQVEPWRLRASANRPHARTNFHQWVASWSSSSMWQNKFEETQSLGVWAAHASLEMWLGAELTAPLRAWSVEPVLRSGEGHHVNMIALATVAASFGEEAITRLWLERALVRSVVRRTRRAIRETLDLDGPRVVTSQMNTTVASTLKKEYESRRRLVAIGSSTSILLSGSALIASGIASLVMWDRWPLFAGVGAAGFFLTSVVGWTLLLSTTPRQWNRHGGLFIEHQAENAAKVECLLAQAANWLAADASDKAKSVIDDAKTIASATLGKDHPLYLHATEISADLMLADRRSRSALESLTPLLTNELPVSDSLALLACRALADTGRAAEAVLVLAYLVGVSLPTPLALVENPAMNASAREDGIVPALLGKPADCLAANPDAHLTLIDALLKQGRYPEALQTARRAVAKFATDDAGREAASATQRLRARLVDLERRLGPNA